MTTTDATSPDFTEWLTRNPQPALHDLVQKSKKVFERSERTAREGFDMGAEAAVQATNDACFIVKDANGLAVAYVYYEEEPGRRTAANLMTRDEARRIAANIVKLPEFLQR
jgi:hypothetical protein